MRQVLRRGKVLTDLVIHLLSSCASPEHTLEVLSQLMDWRTEWGRYSQSSLTVEILETERQRIINGTTPPVSLSASAGDPADATQPAAAGSSERQPAAAGSSEPQPAAARLLRHVPEESVGGLPPLPRHVPSQSGSEERLNKQQEKLLLETFFSLAWQHTSICCFDNGASPIACFIIRDGYK
ncbi:hypothetical protein CRENBAI_010617, partial [Crenichthys baileyi]